MDTLGAYQKITQDFLDTSIDFENLFEKSATVSVEARKEGNGMYTKKKHDQSIHKNILLCYSKSVAFAPNNSEELALAYSNRSALLLHLHLYQKCLVDINRALQISQSNKLKSKLQARKQKCLTLMENVAKENKCEVPIKDSSCRDNEQRENEKYFSVPKVNDEILKLPSITPSKTIQSASEAITVKYNEKYGRHLIATRYIKPGEIIIAERGYVCFPLINRRYIICSNCLSFAWNGIPCEGCAFAIFCSESCRENAWKQYHDIECSLFPYISCLFYNDENFVPDLIVAIRLLIKAVKKEGIDTVLSEAENHNNNQVEALMVNGKLRSNRFRSCINLLSYMHNNEDDGVNMNLSIAASALLECTNIFDYMKDGDDDVTNEDLTPQLESILKKLIGVVDVNSFKYQGAVCNCENLDLCKRECETYRGIIFAPFSSLINHSCNSNVSRMFLPNGKVVLFTVAPVNEGEQLFDSYGPSIHIEREKRQITLRNIYNFTCDCRPCKEHWPVDFQGIDVDERQERSVLLRILVEFKKSFPHASESTILGDDEGEWQYDEETLRHAVKLSELTVQYFDDYMLATLHNVAYRHYIDKAYYMLYGEKCHVPHEC